jgi:REP element-mobilizing transposase RayT
MRMARVLGCRAENAYHVVSRVVDRRFVFGGREKRVFRKLLGQLLAFSGLECVTFCLMSNHFHLLVVVPDKAVFTAGLTDERLLGRLRAIYSPAEVEMVSVRLRELRESSPEAADALWETYVARMCDLSRFVQELKGRFAQWYNRANDRRGTLWEERFRSVLVEGGSAMEMMAAYIDLNPVRAGIVDDPKDYCWSGYGEAVAGVELSRQGLSRLVDPTGSGWTWEDVQQGYRVLLYGVGAGSDPDVRPALGDPSPRRGLAWADVEKVLAEGGRLSRVQLLRCRLRYLCEGVAIGSEGFVSELCANRRARAAPQQRRREGVPLEHGEWAGLVSLRALRGAVIEAPGREVGGGSQPA